VAGTRREKLGELTYRLAFDREERTSAEVIRQVINAVEVLDIAIEEQSIEEVVKQIYTGNLLPEANRCKPA